MRGGFLERWSRLKQEAEPAPAEGEPSSEPAPAAEITEEEIAALPRLEDLTAESDITCFMRPGVPDKLRNAALRRMWLLDSAIRDFVGPARDYSYDWNQIGDVPGSGLLESQEEVAAMLRGLFGDPEPEQDQPATIPPEGDDAAQDGNSPSA
jgi:hypothetical protein